MQITYREATRGEIKKISRMAADSFGEYPMFDLIFRSAFSSKKKYIKYMRRLHSVNVRALQQRNICLVGLRDEQIVCFALLEDPGAQRVALQDYIHSGGLSLLFPVGLKRLSSFFELSEIARRDCMQGYPDSWYLELLVVAAEYKGQGVGSKMLNECIKPYVLSHGGDSITLITNTAQNCRFYEKNGFTEFAHSILTYNDDSVDNWSFCCALNTR